MTDDNKAWRERERQRIRDQQADEHAAEKLYSTNESAKRGGDHYTPYYDAEVANGWRTFGAVAVILAVLAMFILALILFNGGLSRGGAGVLFTGGNCTCVGRPGKDGLNGRDGVDGTCAQPCVDGAPGPAGQNGMCEFHPSCMFGPPGRDGVNGTDGVDGICLAPCVNGTQGPQGLPGQDGVCAQPCVNGTNGIDGINGTNGVCDCFQTDVEVASLTVNTSLTIDGGDILCPNGGTIDLNCLGINMSSCLDFSACDLQAMSLLLQGPIAGATLQVGVAGATSSNMLTRIFFGDSGAANYMLNLIRMFASTTTLVGDLRLALSSRQEVRISTTGISRPIILSATGTLQGISRTGINMVNQISGNVIVSNQAAGGETRIQSNSVVRNTAAADFFVESPDMLFRDTAGGGFNYLEMDSSQSYTINSTNTFDDFTKRSVIMHQDMILVPGKRIISLDPSMKVELGSGIRVTFGSIAAGPAADITLEADPGRTIRSQRDHVLETGVLQGGVGVDLSIDASGVGLQDIRLEDDVTLNTGVINCPIGGCQLNGNVRVNGNFDTIGGGNINAAGDVTAGGACCTSDPRVKRNITQISTSAAVKRVMETPVYEFNYSKDYLKADRNAYAGTLRGFMADQVEKNFPYAVRRVKKQVGDVYMEDLMQLNLQMMLADLWASHQQLRLEVEQLKEQRI